MFEIIKHIAALTFISWIAYHTNVARGKSATWYKDTKVVHGETN